MTRILFFAFAFSATCATLSFAQVAGRIVDADGAPLAGVRVRLESHSAESSIVVTGIDGSFHVDTQQSAGARLLRAHRIGFAPIEQAVRPGDVTIVLRMTAVPLALEGLSATVRRLQCRGSDDPHARAIWAAAAAHYSDATADRGWEFLGWESEASREENDLHRVDTSLLRPMRSRPGSAAIQNRNAIVAAQGYATPLPYRDPGYRAFTRPFFAWRYLRLFDAEAYHFASPVFGHRHTFQLLSDDGEEQIIGFCPRRQDQPYLTGSLAVRSGGMLVSAEWRFHVRNPDERAGGQVVFDTAWVPGETRPHLVAGRGLFWRRQAGSSRYIHVTVVPSAWVISLDREPPPGERRLPWSRVADQQPSFGEG